MIYEVTVEEFLSETFKIEADSTKEALEKAEIMYYNEEIVLEPGHLLGVDFSINEDKSV